MSPHCPESHEELASASSANDGGIYSDGCRYKADIVVEVVVSRRSLEYRCHVISTATVPPEVGRGHVREVVGRGEDIGSAVEQAMDRAVMAEISKIYLVQAISRAEDLAYEFEADERDKKAEEAESHPNKQSSFYRSIREADKSRL